MNLLKRSVFHVFIFFFLFKAFLFNALAGEFIILTGGFDPPTSEDREFILQVLNQQQPKKLYVLVNTLGNKEYLTSVTERIEMVKLMLSNQSDKIEVRGEPFQGKEAFLKAIGKAGNVPIQLLYLPEVGTSLAPEMSDWVLKQGFYQSPTGDELADLRHRFASLHYEFIKTIQAKLNSKFKITDFSPPEFKGTQSKASWFEKFVLEIIKKNKLSSGCR